MKKNTSSEYYQLFFSCTKNEFHQFLTSQPFVKISRNFSQSVCFFFWIGLVTHAQLFLNLLAVARVYNNKTKKETPELLELYELQANRTCKTRQHMWSISFGAVMSDRSVDGHRSHRFERRHWCWLAGFMWSMFHCFHLV